MVEKIVIDPETGVAPELLAQKLNEVIELLSRPPVRPEQRREPGKLEFVDFIEKMLSRILGGPYTAISQLEPNGLTEAIGEALRNTQAAVAAYKESISAP